MTIQKQNLWKIFSIALLGVIAIGTVGLSQDAHASAFPGQNGKIAIGSSWGIEIMNTDGTGRTPLVDTFANGAIFPDFSADGNKIVYRQGGSTGDIYMINTDGTGYAHVASVLGAERPRWSPDGSKIAIEYNVGACASVGIMDSDGSNLTQLVLCAPDGFPGIMHVNDGLNWSPDGTKIIFSAVARDWNVNENGDRTAQIRNCGLYVINVDGTGLTELTHNWGTYNGRQTCGSDTAFASDRWPSWSPDGSQVVFERSTSLDPNSLFTMDADGTGLTDLGVQGIYPHWSPDGTKILITHQPSTTRFFDLHTMNPDGTDLQAITNDSLYEYAGAWQPIPDVEPPSIDADGDGVFSDVDPDDTNPCIPSYLSPTCVLTVCTADQYESAAPTDTTDRMCTALTECTADQYESTPPTETSDRMCTDLTLEDRINNLIELGNSFGANTKVLGNAPKLLNDSNPNNDSGACGKLDAFINKVNSDKKLSSAEKSELVDDANVIKTAIGC